VVGSLLAAGRFVVLWLQQFIPKSKCLLLKKNFGISKTTNHQLLPFKFAS